MEGETSFSLFASFILLGFFFGGGILYKCLKVIHFKLVILHQASSPMLIPTMG